MEYQKLKRYWKIIQMNYKDLDLAKHSKWSHFGTWKSERDIVQESIAVDELLKETYYSYQILLIDIKSGNVASLRAHLEAYLLIVSNHMKICIKTLIENFTYVKNSLATQITNECLEAINYLIKCIKRIAFGYRSYFHIK